jgi:DNA-binding FrmR family transcriptional regulator
MDDVKNESCPHCRTKIRDEKEYKDLITRLNRIEGQIRGIKNMVENNVYCIDILTQVSAAQSALGGFSKVLLSNHVKSCVVNDIKNGKDEVVDELITTLQKMMKGV